MISVATLRIRELEVVQGCADKGAISNLCTLCS